MTQYLSDNQLLSAWGPPGSRRDRVLREIEQERLDNHGKRRRVAVPPSTAMEMNEFAVPDI